MSRSDIAAAEWERQHGPTPEPAAPARPRRHTLADIERAWEVATRMNILSDERKALGDKPAGLAACKAKSLDVEISILKDELRDLPPPY